MANDGMRRQLNANQTNAFCNVSHARIISDGTIRLLSSHDLHCIYGVDHDLELKYNSTSNIGTANAYTRSEATTKISNVLVITSGGSFHSHSIDTSVIVKINSERCIEQTNFGNVNLLRVLLKVDQI